MTGSTPGIPMHTSHTVELGGASWYTEAQEQNILLLVNSWLWTSSPITTSYSLIDSAILRYGKPYTTRSPAYFQPFCGLGKRSLASFSLQASFPMSGTNRHAPIASTA